MIPSNPSSPGPRAVIVTHAQLGAELLNAAGRILGPLENSTALSNDQLEIRILEGLITRELSTTGETFLFSDFVGSSCQLAARRVAATHDRCRTLTGVNLPMLLSFFTKRGKIPADELLQVVREAGCRGINI
jgi:mannose/fructose-specific phosphotransferase system component IIA